MNQLTLNLKEKISLGKKTRRLSVPASEDLTDDIDRLAWKKNTTRASLLYKWIVDGLIKETLEFYMLEDLADKRISDLLE